ncbi:ParM/StbA family protein [Clostridium botulinum]|nr:ParM/StbA family protein [Clostridium botulinum]
MRIAVDIGFGFVKVMNEDGEKISFPSVIAKRSENSLRGIVGSSGDDYSVIYWEVDTEGEKFNEKKCYVGDAAMTNGGTRKWEDKSEFNVEEMKTFISTAVALVNTKNEPVDICVGLPMSYYLQKRDELKEVLQSINAKICISGINRVGEIKFNSVFCFPQGAGAYYGAIFDKDGKIKDYNLATSSVGVIDIGYRTVDYLVMGKGRKGISIIDGLSGSLEEDGMNKAFQNIQKTVSELSEIQHEIPLLDIEKAILWFGSKLDYRRNTINITEYEEEAYKDHAENISAKIKIKWGNEGDLLTTILITGGGATALYPTIQNKFEQAELQEDCSYANCEGYLGAQAKKIK